MGLLVEVVLSVEVVPSVLSVPSEPPSVVLCVPSVASLVLSVVPVVSPVLSPVGVFLSSPPQAVNAKSIDRARSNAIIFFILFLSSEIKKCGNRSHRTEKRNPDCRQTKPKQKRKTLLPSEWSCVFTELLSDDNQKRV